MLPEPFLGFLLCTAWRLSVARQAVSFEMVEKPRRGGGLNWLVKTLGYLCKPKSTFN